jgi:uroporphyrinogen decarboxylase
MVLPRECKGGLAVGRQGDVGALRRLVGGHADRTPVLLWKHFRSDDPRDLAHRTVEFYRRYDLAAAKLMPDIPILFEDFSLSSWKQLLHLRRFGSIDTVGRAPEYIHAVELVRAELEPQDFLLVTLFSPLALIGLWCGPRAVREMAIGPRTDAHAVLWALAQVVNALSQACVKAGADGIYYSCWGQDLLSADEYREFGVPYDLAGLRGAAGAELRLLHVHGALHDSVERYATYPVEIVGWSEQESRIGLAAGARMLPGKFVMGGISEQLSRLTDAGMEPCREHVGKLIKELGGKLVLAPGCSLPDDVDDSTLRALRDLVQQ